MLLSRKIDSNRSLGRRAAGWQRMRTGVRLQNALLSAGSKGSRDQQLTSTEVVTNSTWGSTGSLHSSGFGVVDAGIGDPG